MKVVTDFLFLGSKITVDGDCSISEDDCFLAGINDKPRQCVEKQRHHSAESRSNILKAMVFPVVMYDCETVKKAECQRIDAFKLRCWRRLLKVP